ncbi:MAG: hypothetical protein SOT08_06000 [Candidatus Borkfalkiaceae bacterium]|nr:hypothetical protein [Christensenellaceae bacterium]
MSGADDLYRGNIVSTRVRFARNFEEYPFRIKEPDAAREIAKEVELALINRDKFTLYFMSECDDIKKEAMKERHLISSALVKNSDCGAVLINEDESVSVMINEEDVLREQCIMRGLCLKEAYERLLLVDDDVFDNFDVAFDKDFGYLTACPSNLGTGLRASVMLFLPALTESGKIAAALERFSELGLTVRGLYGEGSEAEGCTYQISNEVTLGMTESEILNLVEDAVLTVCKAEREEEEKLYASHELQTMDRARKSFGILTNAVLLSYGEFLTEMARVKLGAMLGFIDINDIERLDDLTVAVRPSNLCLAYGKRLSAAERDFYRAETVSRILTELKG